MSNEISQLHHLVRTNEKGIPFLGRCLLCGKENLTMEEGMTTRCDNPTEVSYDESLLMALPKIQEPSHD